MVARGNAIPADEIGVVGFDLWRCDNATRKDRLAQVGRLRRDEIEQAFSIRFSCFFPASRADRAGCIAGECRRHGADMNVGDMFARRRA
jgi:hypothetical protein